MFKKKEVISKYLGTKELRIWKEYKKRYRDVKREVKKANGEWKRSEVEN